ncbi:hypothetical protein C3941_10815 [Kaistia algarum]|uniref:hypothetical protein n=1 Tax=Kaistia algarum TaxID=2083279 RepID=UPI000CE80225|nr:hypothetical protein [Kaistia algarum]MCX5514840.1 hypothetical protein [Kaistia algarum]PPE79596.1 hypothetical protein C3941_10815 [Kaistia algarum]
MTDARDAVSSPASADPHAVSLQLSDIHHFFQTPELDPFLGENIEASGMEQVLDTLKSRPRLATRITRIVIHLPASTATDGLALKTRAAIGTYCGAQIRRLKQKKRDIHLQARRAVPVGFGVWAVCLVLSLMSEALLGSEAVIARVFSEGFIIAGWVSLWHPAELLLYDWRPYARDILLYEQIRGMEVVIAPLSDGR